jgi:hypothetical protein
VDGILHIIGIFEGLRMKENKFKIGDLVRMSRDLVPYGPYGQQERVGVIIQINKSPPLYTRYCVEWNEGDSIGQVMWYAAMHLEKIE